jgi:hypothetical protein
MGQLHNLLGPARGDPATRARLALALTWGAGQPETAAGTGGAGAQSALMPDASHVPPNRPASRR